MMNLPKKEPLNLVPFIDIMLVLLAMVLSIATFIAKGEIAVALPKSQTAAAPAQAAAQAQLLQIDNAGTIFWQEEKTTLDALDGRLAALSRDAKVVLRIDKDARFELFIAVIDLLKKHRHENFVIAAEKTNANG